MYSFRKRWFHLFCCVEAITVAEVGLADQTIVWILGWTCCAPCPPSTVIDQIYYALIHCIPLFFAQSVEVVHQVVYLFSQVVFVAAYRVLESRFEVGQSFGHAVDLVAEQVAIEGQPALARDEIDEHEPVEERLGEDLLDFLFGFVRPEAGYAVQRAVEHALVLGEELAGYGLDVEGGVERGVKATSLPPAPVDVGQLRDDGSARQVALYHHAAQSGADALEAGIYQVQMAGVLVW